MTDRNTPDTGTRRLNPERPRAERNTPGKARTSDAMPDSTPGTDMQSEDAGTAASGNASSASNVQPAMKQTGKTGEERNRR